MGKNLTTIVHQIQLKLCKSETFVWECDFTNCSLQICSFTAAHIFPLNHHAPSDEALLFWSIFSAGCCFDPHPIGRYKITQLSTPIEIKQLNFFCRLSARFQFAVCAEQELGSTADWANKKRAPRRLNVFFLALRQTHAENNWQACVSIPSALLFLRTRWIKCSERVLRW